jgi:arylsulfatase A-like enzyme
MPTLTAAAGADQPQDVIIDGKNLLPLATGNGDEAWTRDTLFWQSGHYRVVRHKDWKLQVTARPDKQWLFNLADDPNEQHNLAESEPNKVSELMSLLDAHAAASRPSLYPAVSEQVIAIDKTLAERFEEGDEYIYWPN